MEGEKKENIFTRMLREKDQPPKPYSHPPAEAGKKRVIVESIETTTEKAILIMLKNDARDRKIWVPKSVSQVHYGREDRGVTEEDKNTVIDIDNDFYVQTIGA